MTTITRFTKEQLIAKLQHQLTVTAKFPGVEEAELDAAIFQIALASLEAEPYGYVHKGAYEQVGSCGLSNDHEAYRDSSTHIAIYATPPAPVVPEELLSAMEEVLRISDRDHEAWHKARNGIVSCRASMLDNCATVESRNHAACSPKNGLKCAAARQGSQPVSNRDELPLNYLQGHKDGLEWAAQLAEANHPQTGDWLYDDPTELAKAIRKGPDMPFSDGNSPVIPDGWVACSERMPGSQVWVIVFAKWANQQVLCWDDVANRWTDFEDQSYFPDMFSHWMPLPAAPQQEGK